jgi:DNA-binding MarR family transcriptional regulator
VAKEITTAEYRALAELRYRIRKFVRDGDIVARSAGLEAQQYLLLLAIRGMPEGEEPTIRSLAERLALKHQSTVELIDRLESHGYVRRARSRDDRRRVLVSLQRHCFCERHQRAAGSWAFPAEQEAAKENAQKRGKAHS